MDIKRRQFLKNSLAVSAAAGLGTTALTASAANRTRSKDREFYELRVYRLRQGQTAEALEGFLEKAAIPALNRLGAKPVGVFAEIEPKDPASVFVLIPYPSLEMFSQATARLAADSDYQKRGAEHLSRSKGDAAFDRINSWLMLAFAGMPKLELAPYSKERQPRLFELRTYQSHSESKALKKIEMFNSGEIEVMHQVGLAPVFYGQALVGADLPHLTYMTSGPNAEEHKKHWDAFGTHPVWNNLKNDPQYADTVSKITKWMLKPAACSQI